MVCFVNKNGTRIDITGDHAYFCRSKRISLRRYLQDNIRVKQYRDSFIIETGLKSLSISQKRTIRKLYRDYRCFGFYGIVGKKEIQDIKSI